MPLVLAPIIAFLFTALRIFMLANLLGFIVRILVAFGFTFWVMGPAIDTIVDLMAGRFGVLPPVAAQWIGFFNVDKYVGLILSAYSIQQAGNFILRTTRS